MMEENSKRQTLRIVPLTQAPEASGYNWLTLPMLRHWVFQSQSRIAADGAVVEGNGFDACLLRIGRRILVDLDRFDAWLNGHRNKAGGI